MNNPLDAERPDTTEDEVSDVHTEPIEDTAEPAVEDTQPTNETTEDTQTPYSFDRALAKNKKAIDAFDALEKTATEHNDEALQKLLRLFKATFEGLTNTEHTFAEHDLSEAVEALRKLFALNEGTHDIALDKRQPTKLEQIEVLLRELASKRFPGEKAPEGKWEHVKAGLSSVRSAVLQWSFGPTSRRKADAYFAQNKDRETLDAIIDEVNDARLQSRRRAIKTGVVTLVSGVLAGNYISSSNSESAKENVLDTFKVTNVNGRTISITTESLPETINLIIQDSNKEKHVVHAENGKITVPNTIEKEGGSIVVYLSDSTDEKKLSLPFTINLEAAK